MAEHLEACILPLPDNRGCGWVRETYGLCPDHDGWCAPGCPVTGGGWPQTYDATQEVRPDEL
jgi:hypothetical protein